MLTLILFTFGVPEMVAQPGEKLIPLWSNPILQQKIPASPASTKITLSLPFVDDFSSGLFYPDPLRWSDELAYVNFHYGVRPPSVGVATLDALDRFGAVYTTATAFPFPADTLTSQPIALAGYKQSDSVFFSFQYQPEGFGNAPERDDSLLLEFWSEALQTWVHVWSDRGRSLAAFTTAYGKEWRPVVVEVDSAQFFSPSFRFRFRNFASITDASLPDWGGNVDMWHIDYIVLNTGRSIVDTLIHNDLAFRDYPQSLLAKYHSMPWNQYLANAAGEMKADPDSIKIPYTAYYYNTTNPVLQTYTVKSLTGGTSYTPPPYSFGNLVMPIDIYVRPNPNVPLAGFTFSAPSQPYADFEITAAISPFSATETIRTNDTVSFYQKFYNYYAYDDGSAEAGYGVSSSNPNARLQVALRFSLNVPDTLRAVQICFNQVKDQANEERFTLSVWESDGQNPGDTLYTEEDLFPVFEPGINWFHTYTFTRPVPVTGSFWVGWQQKSGTMLNAGYDRNRNAKDDLRYNIGNGWNASLFDGALMIRPILGDTSEAYVNIPKPKAVSGVRLYPNPAGAVLYVEGSTPGEVFRLEFYNGHGQLLKITEAAGSTTTDGLPEGFYVVRVFRPDTGVLVGTHKLIIANRGYGSY